MVAVSETKRKQSALAAGIAGRDEIASYHLVDETRLLGGLLERAVYTADERLRIGELARRLAGAARSERGKHGSVDAFLHEYGLSSEEGVILMCLAEALLRIPDAETADALIAEKIGGGDWDRHVGRSDNLLVNASTWGLLLTGRIARLGQAKAGGPIGMLKRLVGRSGESMIRQAVRQAMRIMGDQFVLGRTIEEAIGHAAPFEKRGFRFSYDMLGEGARSAKDADRTYQRYVAAIEAIGRSVGPMTAVHGDALMHRPGVSVKLSGIHPRFEPGKEERLVAELVPRLTELARMARARGLTLTVDAEEQDRLDVTLDVFGACFLNPDLDGWSGFGLAVQAYGKRAIPVLRWLKRLSDRGGKRIPVRLVKGAYWDSEIKWAQERGLADYPVFSDKRDTDVSYLAAMRFLFADQQAFYPQIATHNAHSIATAIVAGGSAPYELQRLHGMGETIYDDVLRDGRLGAACRIYAPVGGHEDLLAYLVRRLLENGANTSFVNRLADDALPIEDIIRDPVSGAEQRWQSGAADTARRLPKPGDIFAPGRRNSLGLALTEAAVRGPLLTQIATELAPSFAVGPIIDGVVRTAGPTAQLVTCPHDNRQRIGTVVNSSPEDIERALVSATAAARGWDRMGGPARGAILDKAADLFERNRAKLMAVLVREAGKTLEAAQGDVREAVDFLRYYAVEARRLFGGPVLLPGPTGERNTLELHGRGVFACISPWNFPVAIFTGQIAAALAAGNAVIAKPAGQTPISGFVAVELLHEAGVPGPVLHLLPGAGSVGAALAKDPRVGGIAFTGSNTTAWSIQMALAERRGAIIPFIAETGGINAMIADSSALPEQVVRDAVRSAFDSAGQRCSAARVLFLQQEIADHTIDMLRGAVEELEIGDPLDFVTDIGPVIDQAAQDALESHKIRMQRHGHLIIDRRVPEACRVGTYVSPAVYELGSIDLLDREVFGPILHVVRYPGGRLDRVVAAINTRGFGLTLGLHSRIAAVADYVAEHARVGNLYVNRNQIGAVVGVQPFGGEGLSGTGPKVGGPNTLIRYAVERVRSTDSTVTGGNIALLGLGGQGGV